MTKAQQIKLHKSAEKAMREAVKKVVLEHKKSGLPLAVWERGKVVYISADDVDIKNLLSSPRKRGSRKFTRLDSRFRGNDT